VSPRQETLCVLYDRLRANVLARDVRPWDPNLRAEHQEILRLIHACEPHGGPRTQEDVKAMLQARVRRNAERERLLRAGLPIPARLMTPALRRKCCENVQQ